MNNSIKTLLAFAGGAAAGAIVGVLLAPSKGSKTRKRLMNRTKHFGESVTDAAKAKFDGFVDWKNDLLEDAEDAVKQNTDHNAVKSMAK